MARAEQGEPLIKGDSLTRDLKGEEVGSRAGRDGVTVDLLSSHYEGPLMAGGRQALTKMACRVLSPLMVMTCLMLLLFIGACSSIPVSDADIQDEPMGNWLMEDEVARNDDADLNFRPIIGILAQELSNPMNDSLEPHNYTQYIAASYVKFYESGGARIVPVLINQPEDYYINLSSYLNGMIFPGGSASITVRSGYGQAGKLLFQLLQERNPPVPLMGTCLGFEMLLYLTRNRYPLSNCRATNRADPLIPNQPDWEESKLFGNLPADVNDTFVNTNATSNFHTKCITTEKFRDLSLDEDYKLLSINYDDNNIEYVSTVEHKTLPFYGVQWHPEKNPFEWSRSSIPHSRSAIRAAQYIANFFVEEARHNNQTFPTDSMENEALIYNYNPIYVASYYSSSFQQCYLFP